MRATGGEVGALFEDARHAPSEVSFGQGCRAQRVRAALFERQASPPELGRFRVLGELGRGGMGTVFVAHDPRLGREVAIKLLHRVSARSRARLHREARSMARLSHPHVLPVFELQLAGPRPFVVMQLVQGRTLGQWLTEPQRSCAEIVAMFRQAGSGLLAAHTLGMVHRDFKPSNVLIDHEDRARVTDFGLARGVDDGAEPSQPDAQSPPEITAAGAVVGTPRYMAPEQYDGHAGPRTDQFSFCKALYEALTGERPTHDLRGRTINPRATKRVSLQLRSMRGLGWRARRAIARGLCADPADRWPGMQDLLTRLERPRRAHRGWVAGAVLATVALGGTWLVLGHDDPCGVHRQRIDEVWNEDASERLAQALGSYPSHGQDTWSGAKAQVDDFAAQWTDARLTTCDNPAAPPMAAVCFDRTLHRLEAALAVIEGGDPGAADNATLVLPSAASLDACSVPAARWPQAPVLHGAELESVQRELAQARAQLAAGAYDRAHAHATTAKSLARAGSLRALQVEATVVIGDIDRSQGRPEAGPALRTAYLDAAAIGATRWALEAALGLAEHRALDRADPEDAQRWLERAELLGATAGGDRGLALRHAGTQINLLIARGDLVEAIAQGNAAADGAWASGDPAVRRRSLVLATNLGVAQLQAGRDAQALATFTRTQVRQQQLLGSRHPALVATFINLASAHGNLGQSEQARAWLVRARSLAERSLRPSDGSHATVAAMLGELARRDDRLDDALRFAQQAHAALERRLPAEHPELLASEGRLIEFDWEGGQPAEALRAMTALVERAQAAEIPPLPLARLRIVLGQWRAQLDPPQAEAPLRLALEAFSAIDPRHPGARQARIELAWLALHRDDLQQAARELEGCVSAPDDPALTELAQGRLALARARVAAASGQLIQARTLARRSTKMFEAAAASGWRTRAQTLLDALPAPDQEMF